MASKSSSVTDRIGTDGASRQDEQLIEKVKRFAFKSYEDEIIVKLPFCDHTSSTNTLPTSVNGFYQFKANSIYDPDQTGVGHQPLGRDTWASIYNYYKVLETNIKLEIIDTNFAAAGGSGATVTPTYYGMMLDITGTAPASRIAWLEAAEGSMSNRQQVFSEIKMANTLASKNPNPLTFYMKWTPELFDKNIIQGGGDSGWTSVSGDPTLLEYLTLIAWNPEATSRYCHWRITMEYIVAFKQVNRTLMNTTN